MGANDPKTIITSVQDALRGVALIAEDAADWLEVAEPGDIPAVQLAQAIVEADALAVRVDGLFARLRQAFRRRTVI
jgi:hypothetical protein